MISRSLLAALFIPAALAATAEEWRQRSIYQIITDRFALPPGADKTKCDPGDQVWCGGTWNSIRENLDYVQQAGFTAVWISPVSKGYAEKTAYGYGYHNYWTTRVDQLQDKFGTAEDLKALSNELHKRGMYLMVDVVVNNVMATTMTPDYSQFFFKDKSFYHPYCPIKWGDFESEKNCWLGDEKVPLPDVDTQNPKVVSAYKEWVKGFVQEYGIDGLRIDAAKHTNTDFWPEFCGAAGVFCMGEVFGDDLDYAATYQGPNALDSILNFPMYNALVDGFAIPGPRNSSAVAARLAEVQRKFKDPGLLGNFIENHDVPRWSNISVDPQSLYNAMTFNFMTDGIPIVYYGQEQFFHGVGDPYNREPMWTSDYKITIPYRLISTLNQLRNFLVQKDDWLKSKTEVLTVSEHGIAVIKGSVISILTNIGSPPQNGTSIDVHSPWEASTATTNIITCQQWAVGSSGMLSVEYTKGGVPVILIPTILLEGSGICEVGGNTGSQSMSGLNTASEDNGAPTFSPSYFSFALLVLSSLALFNL